MGRHYKAAVLPSSLCRAGCNRNPIVIGRVAGVKRCIRLLAKTFSFVHLAVLAFFIICFSWCLWRLPQVQDAYPDDVSPCPASSYKILDDQNITIGCTPCPECPSGQQLIPPCGSITQSEAAIACTACPSETYKEGYGMGTCKQCQTCGLRENISQCTSQKNTRCGDCPRGYYQEDYTMDSCKKCSTCCGRFAELECIYLKQCLRKNCTQLQMEIQQNRVLNLEKVAKRLTTPGRIARQRRMAHQSVSQSDNLGDTRNWVLREDIVSQLKKTDFKREVNMTLQRADTVKYASKMFEEESTALQDPPTTATVNGNDATISFSNKSKSQDGLDTAPDHNTVESTLPLASSYFGNFKGLPTSLIVSVVGIAIVVLILIAVFVACACWKRQSGHLPGSGCTVTCCAKYIYLRDGEEYLLVPHDTTPPKSDCGVHEIVRNSDNVLDGSEKGGDTSDHESFGLSDISLNLENTLVKKLDVCHKGEYGWQKLGSAFGVDKDDLKYLETAYKRDGGSPTKDLLDILNTQGRTVADLINALKGPKVNRPDVASHICRLIRSARK